MTQSGPFWEEGRYLDVLGDPIGSDCKSDPGVMGWKSPITQTCVLGELALVGLFKNLDYSLAVFPALGWAGGWVFKKVMREGLGEQFSKACIDTKPEETAIRLEEHKADAKKIVEACNRGLITMGALTGAGYMLVNFGPGPYLLAAGSSVFLCYLEYRKIFNKIAKGEWMIVEMPRPLPQEEKAPVMLAQPVLS